MKEMLNDRDIVKELEQKPIDPSELEELAHEASEAHIKSITENKPDLSEVSLNNNYRIFLRYFLDPALYCVGVFIMFKELTKNPFGVYFITGMLISVFSWGRMHQTKR